MLIAVYGSLKRGFYNHSRFGMSSMLLVQSGIVEGFKMWRVDGVPFPFVTRNPWCEDMTGRVSVEVYEIDEQLFDVLDRMESGAGYMSCPVIVGTISATMWIVPERPMGAKPIEDGVWTG